ncbi:5-formyltetrahydrofolate cyclo-ligase [Deinococcus radiopugnans]|uniref:5-formyltetrahydrofolate cyclo-ligase n=1 Tax=Deinococcus radiopugnans ATCC 19172 TaxID=585398 RepID=A0A5C4Y3H7_9DEIO|nr:5-formyltetrahydrofolate cyclo-ligase [Deinococcus radiopugnans]MBB6017287.1 5-formyltetrahydrofolate cyclo-ligase [Deinococcus radiopugnans ATCC 19172]TNM70050.1 5-formyltetrahydrofolate cyclo-ligase [Deinococcus radiopugnans ATCC 19172]
MTLPPEAWALWDKGQWRAWAWRHREQLPDPSAAITAHLGQFLREAGARRVLAYRALPGEPDVSALAHDFELLAPRARFRPTPRLTLHPWATATEASRFGVLQPPADAPEVSLDTIDAVLLPGLAFDGRGIRLGYGGGFYDRLLPAFHGLTVGVIAGALIVPELPAEDHDCPVAWLATEDGVLRVPVASSDGGG